MKQSRVNPLTAALMLAAILGTSGQSTPSAGGRATQPAAKADQQQTQSTKTNAPTNQQTTRQQVQLVGGGPDPRQRRNPLRQARRFLERMGWVTSGRQWRKFRKLARRDHEVMRLLQIALEMSPSERSLAIRLERSGQLAAFARAAA